MLANKYGQHRIALSCDLLIISVRTASARLQRPSRRAAQKGDELAAPHAVLPKSLRTTPCGSKHSTLGMTVWGLGWSENIRGGVRRGIAPPAAIDGRDQGALRDSVRLDQWLDLAHAGTSDASRLVTRRPYLLRPAVRVTDERSNIPGRASTPQQYWPDWGAPRWRTSAGGGRDQSERLLAINWNGWSDRPFQSGQSGCQQYASSRLPVPR